MLSIVSAYAISITQRLVSSDKYSIKCPYSMTPSYITIHNTANDASAANEISYMVGNTNEVSYHVAVDDVQALQGVPFNRNAWHAGDGGSGAGNRQSIGIEICYSRSGGSRYYAAEKNAADVTAQLMKQFGISISNVVPHQKWSGKYCPHRMLDEGRWNTFIGQVKSFYGGSTPTPVTPSSGYQVGSYQKSVRTTTALNCRSGRGTSNSLITTFASGATVGVWYIDKASDGSLWGSCSCASKTGYIYMDYTTPI